MNTYLDFSYRPRGKDELGYEVARSERYKDQLHHQDIGHHQRFSTSQVFNTISFHLSYSPLSYKKQSSNTLPSTVRTIKPPQPTMHSALVLASLLPFLASAKPIHPRQSTTPTPFGLIAGRSGSPIHLQTVNANGQRFWIGKDASTYCPSDVVTDCPPGTSTELLAADGTASMVTSPCLSFFPMPSLTLSPLLLS